MKFSAVLLASAAALVSAKKFTIVAIRSGSDIQNTPVVSDGKKLVLGGEGGIPTTYEVKDGVLYANDKAVQFGNGATIEDGEGQGTDGVTVDGQDHLYVPNYSFTACAAQGRAYKYTVTSSDDCKQGATPFAARVIYEDDNSSESAAANGTAVTKTGVVTAQSTQLVTITSCEDDKCHKPTAAPAPGSNNGAVVSQIGDGQIQAPPSAAPEQANGAAALGVSAAAAGVVAAAMLF
ncbi:hypothetical protein B0I72DRAFT_137497 [Yarrowia lipolytica]|jgi:hypothetical protein|uniref:YALI0F18282p n=2 Tax=Yarrowia lipolytica TaxID=4952 RepID=Q6C191_YARLI|nr:YALI0F18282p [Yarrowia lipolytica CLIB122]AOW07356.1 hypothetical protein YALI1_F24247g [Yarrowia lipolytica]KAB8286429.1 hypothetical protein BKA91DRAFT_131636 [Yarrowia lipolytica]KAE8174328.1 hypothetical protein BKA90DRAFT_134300 [Yarrowia lipolytica]KAJ8055549.1 hypothetical protein LXG23DRAFT_35198 [Yarrowia lipolytica]QNQ01065.1 Hypothetical protein YALI2_F00610g [Yarrowia lipolytica]|eukprot:XP_505571.1 YALI0F18282p [Yarrowia lipolytica CLIB122]